MKIKRSLLLVCLFLIMLYGCSNQLSNSFHKESKSLLLKSTSKVQSSDLWTILDKKQEPNDNKYLSIIRDQPTAIAVHVAHLTGNWQVLLKKYKNIAIPVSKGKEFILIKTGVKKCGGINATCWGGTLQNGKGLASFVLGSDGITGTLQIDSLLYQFEPIGGGFQAIIQVDQSKFPSD